MEEWIKQGPSLKEIVTESMDKRRKKKGKLAVIIPTFKNNQLLKKHLDKLAEQTFRDFDIIIVYGKDDDFFESKMSILHIRERGRNGSAGSFYIGEKAALTENYDRIVLADNDCLPESSDLLEKFMETSNTVVLPNVLYHPSPTPQKGYVIHHYGCLKNEVLRKTGLTFLPFYFGGEDFELNERINDNGFEINHVTSLVSHPKNKPALISSEKRKYYCGRGELESLLINGRYARALIFTILYLEMGLAFFFTGKKNLAHELFRSVWNATGMEFFKSRYEPQNKVPEPAKAETPKADTIISEEEISDLKNKHWLSAANQNRNNTTSRRISSVLSRFLDFRKYLSKSVLLVDRSDPADLPALLMAKNAYLKFQGNTYIIHENRSLLSIITGILSLALLTPLVILISFPLILRGIFIKKIRKISSKNYGLDS